jgi:hypothetical protein
MSALMTGNILGNFSGRIRGTLGKAHTRAITVTSRAIHIFQAVDDDLSGICALQKRPSLRFDNVVGSEDVP